MKGQWALILAIFFALVIAIFSVVNVRPVTFSYVFGETQWPLILIILGSVFMGALIVGFIGLVRVYRLQKSVKRLEKELRQYRDPSIDTQHEEDKSQITSETLEQEPEENN